MTPSDLDPPQIYLNPEVCAKCGRSKPRGYAHDWCAECRAKRSRAKVAAAARNDAKRKWRKRRALARGVNSGRSRRRR